VRRSSGGGTSPPPKGADVFTRARLICAGLLAAATTAVLVGAPAVVQAGLSFNALD
jgi:hypothetical protein